MLYLYFVFVLDVVSVGVDVVGVVVMVWVGLHTTPGYLTHDGACHACI